MRLPEHVIKNMHPESLEQIAVCDWIRNQHPWLIEHTIYICNDGKRSKLAGYIMKLMGLLPGATDLFIARPTSKFYGLFIEMKTKKGKPTKTQLDFIARMNTVGYYATVCYGADEAIAVIREYLKP